MPASNLFKIPKRKLPKAARFVIGKYDPNKKQTLPRGYDGRGYASGTWGNGNIVGSPTDTGAAAGTAVPSAAAGGSAVVASVDNNEPALMESTSPYKYGCILANITPDISDWLGEWAKRNISQEDLYVNPDIGIDGYENDHHVSLLYGIHDCDPSVVDESLNAISGELPEMNFGDVSRFADHPDYDVMKISLASDLFKNIVEKLGCSIPHDTLYPEFTPHITLAHVKKGACPQLDGNTEFMSMKDKPTSVRYCDRFGETMEYMG